MKESAFSSWRYLDAQLETFERKLNDAPSTGRVFIEFGGKPVDDQHAARVLPGYDPNVKIEILRNLNLFNDVSIVVAVSARDLLRPRIRGDSQLFYDNETIALVKKLRAFGLTIDAGIITMVEENYNNQGREKLDEFRQLTKTQLGMYFFEYPYIKHYPNLYSDSEWGVWKFVHRSTTHNNRHVLVLSPGGGSGKFGVCISELYRDYISGLNSFYIKFETFPVFSLSPSHPLNIAFVAATADLGNTVSIEDGGVLTTYDKDMENFRLLKRVHQDHCPDPTENPITRYRYPSDMGVNRITAGIVDEKQIRIAANKETARRRTRYEDESRKGIESQKTIEHMRLHTKEVI